MTPSRRPPLPIWSGWPSSSETFSSRRTPVVRMRTRSRVELEAPGDVGGGLAGQDPDPALERLVLEHRADQSPQRGGAAADRDGLRRAARSRPPRRSPRSGRGSCGSRPPRAGRRRSARRRAPRSRPARSAPPRPRRGPSRGRPRSSRRRRRRRRSCRRPGWPSVFVAPMKARRPSSSSLRISTGTPEASAIVAATASPLPASRTAAVATARIVSAPSSRARRTWVATTSTTSSIFSGTIAPSSSIALLIRV